MGYGTAEVRVTRLDAYMLAPVIVAIHFSIYGGPAETGMIPCISCFNIVFAAPDHFGIQLALWICTRPEERMGRMSIPNRG